jgi:S-adenosylmethionine/arginine decarboxylase-like enzyme
MAQTFIAKKSWGYHLVLDLIDCNKNIDSEEVISEFFGALISLLNMEPLSELMIKSVYEPNNNGISAVQMITTSCIMFHGDNLHNATYIDVFSCKCFEPMVAIELCKKYFSPSSVKEVLLNRG